MKTSISSSETLNPNCKHFDILNQVPKTLYYVLKSIGTLKSFGIITTNSQFCLLELIQFQQQGSGSKDLMMKRLRRTDV